MAHPRPTTIRNLALCTAAVLLVGAVGVAAQPAFFPEHARAQGAREKHAFDDANATLGVIVMQPTADGRSPAAGAQITVYEVQRATREARDGPERGRAAHYKLDEVASATADANGTASFELPEGYYLVRAEHDGRVGQHRAVLDESKRVGIMLAGRDGHPVGPFALGVRALARSEDGPVPVAGATLTIQTRNGTPPRGPPADDAWRTVATGTTDAEGLWSGTLPRGVYRVLASTDELVGRGQILLRQDQWLRVGLHPLEDESQ